MSFNLITVKIAEYKTARSPDVLRTVLGSCIGICLYDPSNKIGGLAHIMLPAFEDREEVKTKYADCAIPLLIDKMEKGGANRSRIIAKIVGGATMLKIPIGASVGNIGTMNIEMVKKILKENDVKLIAEDVGGNIARTIDFFIDDGTIKVKSSNKVLKTI